MSERVIGERVTRLEDPPLVRGDGRFAGDISFPHQLHMRILRSDRAHAEILSVDCEAARALRILADVVPTLCQLTDLPTSPGMDGHTLVE